MSTMTRTDIHRPSAVEFDPENYDVFGFADFHETDGYRPVEIVSALVDQGWSFRGAPHGSGQCSHCGARLRYAALMGHRPTKTLLYIGETCLDNRFSMTAAEFQKMRKAAALNAERRSRVERLAEVLETYPALVWASYAHNIASAGAVVEWTTAYSYGEEIFASADEAQAWIATRPAHLQNDYPVMTYKRGTTWSEKTRTGWETSTLADIWDKAVRYGDLSDKQAALVERLVSTLTTREVERVTRENTTAALVAAGAKVVAGRQVITGKVLSVKWKESIYGGSLKMTVQAENGTKYWGTVPSSLEVEKDDVVTFTATVETSDDPLFGFFKRPTKASKA